MRFRRVEIKKISKNSMNCLINSVKLLLRYIYLFILIIIIQDSNQFHAICLDTYPPIFYLNQFSKQVI